LACRFNKFSGAISCMEQSSSICHRLHIFGTFRNISRPACFHWHFRARNSTCKLL